jgi:FAM32A
MGDYDFKPGGSLKLKGVKDKRIKKIKKDKPKKGDILKSSPPPAEETDTKDKTGEDVVPQTESERRFEEIQRLRVRNFPHPHTPFSPDPLLSGHLFCLWESGVEFFGADLLT